MVLFALIWRRERGRERLASVLLAAVLGFTLVYGTVHLSITKYGQWETDGDLIAETYDSVEELNGLLPEDGFYRLDAYDSYNNLGLWLNKSCIQFFNSTVAPSILEFYPSVGVKRDVNSKPGVDNYALRGLLGVRFTLVPLDSEQDWLDEKVQGWTRYGETARYAVYENDNFVPPGTAYDYYVTQEQLDAVPEDKRANVLMKAVLLDEEQISLYGANLKPLPEEALEQRTYEAYAADCAARRKAGVTAFTATSTGFTAVCSYDRETLVLFPVPYDDGFAATVNGQPASIEKVDNGLMAVLVPSGQGVTVEFSYRTRGLSLSAAISAAAAAVYLAYLLWLRRKRNITI